MNGPLGAGHGRWRQRACLGVVLVAFMLPGWGASSARAADDLPTGEEIEESILRGVRFLIQYQNKDGSWGSARRTKGLNIYAPIPGAHQAFRAAVTSMGVAALVETGAADSNEGARIAYEKGRDWLMENLPNVRRATPDAIYNVWAHAYGLQALLHIHQRARGDAAAQKKIRALIAQQVDLLDRYESVDGGWGYYDFDIGAKQPATSSTSFVTATVLLVFEQMKAAGLEAPEKLVRRGVASIHRQQKSDFSYMYGEYLKYQPMRGINRPGGSLGRSQACNLALRRWGDTNVTDEVMVAWLDRLVTRNGWLDIGRKRPIPHEAWFQVAGYFFYYGHYYAGLCIEELGDHEAAPKLQRELAGILVPLQEKDGSWWDFPFYDYHQPYGTAYALMALARCRPRP